MGKYATVRILLAVAGAIGIGVGGTQLFMPVAFESSAGIGLGDNSSLLSEIRAAGGTLLAASILILSGAFLPALTSVSLLLSTLFYLSYGLSRLLSGIMDGIPSESLVIATVVEMVVGMLSLLAWYKLRKEGQMKTIS
jgi:hypothetical protein